MGLYGFKKQFEDAILSGEKRQTIRGPRKNFDNPGDIMHLYTGLRQKCTKLLMRVPCVKVEGIIINSRSIYVGKMAHCLPWAAQKPRLWASLLDESACDLLAKNDGFESYGHLMTYFAESLPFVGTIYHWDFERRTA